MLSFGVTGSDSIHRDSKQENRSQKRLFKIDIDIEHKISTLFTKEDRPTAVFVHDDYLALRVIAALQKLHLSIPEDVSLVAPGDTLDYSEPHIPPITTMRINTSLIGKISAELMLSRLHNNPDDIQVLKVKEQLVKRGSCRKL